VSTIFGVDESFSGEDVLLFGFVAGSVVIIEVAVIFLIARLTDRRILVWAVASAFLVANACSLNLVFVEAFIALGPAAMFLVLAIGFFMAFVVLRLATESRIARHAVLLASVVLVAFPILTHFVSGATNAREDARSVNGMTASPKIRKVSFVKKPNVYFIGFESAAPAAILQKYLGLRQAPLPEAFEELGFRVLRNLFSEGQATFRSFNLLLALDRDYLRPFGRDGMQHLFQGLRPSPLVELFKANGYETTALYPNSYFIRRRGKFIDHVETNIPFSVCQFLEGADKRFGFFGACFVREKLFAPKAKIGGPDINFLMYHLAVLAKRDSPQFLIAHITPPRHTPSKEFSGTPDQVSAFRTRYAQLSTEAAANIRQIKDFLEINDPGAILFAFGDHGTWLSRRQDCSKDPTFCIQDRYAVLGGIYPSNACSDSLNAPVSDGYLTVPETARLIVRCLANGMDPFAKPYQHFPRHDIDLKTYVYE
jgi:hypothetical protein